MPTFYLTIVAVSSPFDLDVDDQNRSVHAFNIEAHCRAPSDDFPGEIASLITAAGGGTLGTDLFIGPKAVFPTGDGPYTLILTTGGAPSDFIHENEPAALEHLSAQITVRAVDYDAGRTEALLAWRALDGVRNQTVTA